MNFLRGSYFDRKLSAYLTGIAGNGITCEDGTRVVESDGAVLEPETELEVYAFDKEAVSRCRAGFSTLRGKRYSLYCEWGVGQ